MTPGDFLYIAAGALLLAAGFFAAAFALRVMADWLRRRARWRR
jgi:hypothetical protein